MDQALLDRSDAGAGLAAPVLRRNAFDPKTFPIYAGLAVAWVTLSVAMPLAGLSIDVTLTLVFILVCSLFAWAAACLRMRGFMRAATGLETWMLLTLSCLTGILGTYVAARHAPPLADGWMAAADRTLLPGLDWRETMIGIARHPSLMHLANRAYASIQWQGSLLILLCCVAGQADRCTAFVLRWMIALALVCVIFAFLPCLGPYAHYGIAHAQVPGVGSAIGWRQPEILAGLRMEESVRLDPSALDGIVEFPSFHTAAAILFAWGFWAIRWARWPMLFLNLAMIAASVPIGGHYYVDVVAGAIVAWVAIKAPRWIVSLRAR